MLKLVAAGVLAWAVSASDLSLGDTATTDATRGGSHYGGRRNWADSALPEGANISSAEWLAKKLHKAERDAARASDAEWRKGERKAYRQMMEDDGVWASMGKTNAATKMGADTWGNRKGETWTALGGEYEDSELAAATRAERNTAYRARARDHNQNQDDAARAASTNCKTLYRGKLQSCLTLEEYAKADKCADLINDNKGNRRDVLSCTLMADAGF